MKLKGLSIHAKQELPEPAQEMMEVANHRDDAKRAPRKTRRKSTETGNCAISAWSLGIHAKQELPEPAQEMMEVANAPRRQACAKKNGRNQLKHVILQFLQNRQSTYPPQLSTS